VAASRREDELAGGALDDEDGVTGADECFDVCVASTECEDERDWIVAAGFLPSPALRPGFSSAMTATTATTTPRPRTPAVASRSRLSVYSTFSPAGQTSMPRRRAERCR